MAVHKRPDFANTEGLKIYAHAFLTAVPEDERKMSDHIIDALLSDLEEAERKLASVKTFVEEV